MPKNFLQKKCIIKGNDQKSNPSDIAGNDGPASVVVRLESNAL